MNKDNSLLGLGETLSEVLRSLGVRSADDLRRFGAFSVFPAARDLCPSLSPKNLWMLLALEKGLHPSELGADERRKALSRWNDNKAALLWQSRCLFFGLWPNDWQRLAGLPVPSQWPFLDAIKRGAKPNESCGVGGCACKAIGDSRAAPSNRSQAKACDSRPIRDPQRGQCRTGESDGQPPRWTQGQGQGQGKGKGKKPDQNPESDDGVLSLLPIASPWRDARSLLSDRCVGFQQDAMEEALRCAKNAADKGAPPIGAVVAQRGRIVSAAGNEADGLKRHAEIAAIAAAKIALGADKLIDCDLHVTLEPCLMCCGEIFRSRLRRVFVGAVSQKTGAAVSGPALAFHPQFNPHAGFVIGVEEERAAELLTVFFGMKRD